ncbi:MAG: S41 family peptidase [Desulfobacterales bacterium]
MKKSVIVLFLILTTTLSCTTKFRNIRSFETVWQTVNQAHYDPTFGGVDWKAAHEQYKPQIAAAENKEESFLLINQMLFKLNLSHLLAIYPDDLKRYMPVLFAEGDIGADVRLLDGEAVITMVRTGTPAAHAGLRPGFIIERIDGIPVEQIIQEGEALLIPPFNARNRLNNLSGYISGHIYGPPNTTVKIHFRDKDGKGKEAVIHRESRGRGRFATEAMPPYYVEFEAKRLGNNIGYVWFNHWAEPVDGKFIAALSSMRDIRGLIIDLRGNPGGFLSVVHTITKHLLAEKTQVSSWKFRNQRVEYSFDPARDAYLGPVVVLIDVRSTSSSEYFAGSMQSIHRAVIVGERSPGYLLIANWKKLFNGMSFMYAFAQPIMPDGKIIEGNGVVPDIEVKLDRDALLKGKDSQLDAAVNYIETKTH